MGRGTHRESIDELLDRAVLASNLGDRVAATALAGQVLAVDQSNPEAEDLLASFDRHGEIRRLTLMFIDLVDSTVLSTRVEPEVYRNLVGSFRDQAARLVDQYEGHIFSIKGDGLLAVFGHPVTHEDDVQRAVSAGLDITRVVARLSKQAQHRFAVTVDVRVGIHRGLVYLDTAEDDVYGFAANLASRISGLADPGTVAVSDAVAALVDDVFEVIACPAASVKGVKGPVSHHRVVAERHQPAATQSVPLVGRTNERTWLEHAWEELRGADPATRCAAFVGDPGIGKTRLVRQAAELVGEAGGIVVELRGSPLHTGTGLHPIRRLLERRCGITRLTDGATRLQLLEADLKSLAIDPGLTIPLLAPVLGISPEYGYPQAAVEGRKLYDLIGATVLDYVMASLEGRPGLVIAEDVHWFDPSTMDLVNALVNRNGSPFMFVLTGRDKAWLQTDWPITVFDLKPLDDGESDALIEALNPTVTRAQRAAVRTRCDGVPFYIEHVVASLDTSDSRRVPEALYEPLLARLHARTGVVPVIEAAAVIGRSGDFGLLDAVVDHQPAIDIHTVVDQLVAARVLEHSGVDGWRFRHELQRQVAAELAPPTRRRELHARAAAALIDSASGVEPDWRVVAMHFESAQRSNDAVDAYRKASTAARRRGALAEARSFLTSALERLQDCSPGAARDRAEIAVRLERGYLAGATQGTWSGAGPADFERCLELASSGDYQDELFTTLTALIGYYMPRAELNRAKNLIDALTARLNSDRSWSHPAIESSLGSVLWLQGDFSTAHTHLDRALADSSAANPQVLDTAWWVPVDPISTAHVFLALTHMLSGDLEAAEADLSASVQRCEALSFPQNVHNRAHTYFMEVWVRLESGHVAEAAALAAELRRYSETAGLDLWRLVGATESATVKAVAALDAGADAGTLVARAERIMQLVDASRLLNLNSYLTFHDSVAGRLLMAAGRSDDARRRLELALRHADETGMRFHNAELTRLLALTMEDNRLRHDGLRTALELARDQGVQLFELRCLLDLFETNREQYRTDLSEAVDRFGTDGAWPEIARGRGLLS